jgi:hypothetical protein
LTFGGFYVLVLFVSPAGIAETRSRMLGELAELGLVLARDLQQAALVAEDPQDKVRLAEAFARVGRGVRQSLALHARMERDAARAAADAETQAVGMEPVRRSRRKAEVRSAVEAVIWREHERLDVDPDLLLEDLNDCLDAEARTDVFLHTDPATQIARLCRALELPIPSEQDDGGAPTDRSTNDDRATPKPETPGDPGRPLARATDPGRPAQGDADGEWRSSA